MITFRVTFLWQLGFKPTDEQQFALSTSMVQSGMSVRNHTFNCQNTPVTAIVAVQQAVRELPWLNLRNVRDIELIRITDICSMDQLLEKEKDHG